MRSPDSVHDMTLAEHKKLVQEPYATLKFLGVSSTRTFFLKVAFFLSNFVSYLLTSTRCYNLLWILFSSFTLSFSHLGSFVTILLYLLYFQGVNDWRQENQENTRRSKGSSREDEEKVKNSIWEFQGWIKITPKRNGSLETRQDITVFDRNRFACQKSHVVLFYFLGWNICIDVFLGREKK